MKQKYKKLALLTLLLGLITDCMFLGGCTENTGNGSQSNRINSDTLQNTEDHMELVPGPMKASEQEKASETEQQKKAESESTEENDTENGKTAGNQEKCEAGIT